MIECPHCKEYVDPGVVCEQCGQSLEPDAAPPPSPEPDVVQPPLKKGGSQPAPQPRTGNPTVAAEAAGAVDADEFGNTGNATSIDRLNTVPSFRSETGSGFSSFFAEEEPATEDDEPTTNECPHFSLHFNTARAFITEFISTFNFQLTCLNEEARKARDVEVELIIPVGKEERLKRKLYAINAARPNVIDLNFRPSFSGMAVATDVFLSYTVNGRRMKFYAACQWDCYPPTSDSSKVVENLVVKLGDVRSDMAADQNINILKDFRPQSTQDLYSRLRQLQPVWRQLGLLRVGGAGAADDVEKTPDRVTLSNGRQRIHILGTPELTFGRKREMASIVTRNFGPNGQPAFACNDKLSRLHATLAVRNGALQIGDGGLDRSGSRPVFKPTAWGTFVNGERVSPGGSRNLPDLAETVVSLAGGIHDRGAFAIKVRPCRDTDGAVGGAVITRCDTQPEAYLWVLSSIALDGLDHGYLPATIVKRGQSLGIRMAADAPPTWLVPGRQVSFGGANWSVCPFAQFGTND